MMKAVVIYEQGLDPSALKISEVARPVPGPGQILVRNAFAGLNFIDNYFRTGLYKAQTPFVLGKEGSGFIETVGLNVDPGHFGAKSIEELVGKRVAYIGDGSYAEYTAANYKTAFSIPDFVSFEDATVLTLQGLTAHYLVHSITNMAAGDYVLVHACAGGTGQLIVQVAKAEGLTVIGTCSAAKMSLAKSLGCDYVIDYNKQDVVKEVKEITKGKGVKLVLDGVGKSTFQSSLDSLGMRGTLCVFGNTSGEPPAIEPVELSKRGSLSLTRPRLWDYIADPKELLQRVHDIFGYVERKQLKAQVDKIFDLEDAGKSHEYIESGKTTGKVLIRIS